MLKKVAFDVTRGCFSRREGCVCRQPRLFSRAPGLFRDAGAKRKFSRESHSFVLLFIQKLVRISWGRPFTARNAAAKRCRFTGPAEGVSRFFPPSGAQRAPRCRSCSLFDRPRRAQPPRRIINAVSKGIMKIPWTVPERSAGV